MDSLFSHELKDLLSQSREVAISLGYNHITTIHFFIAECDGGKQNSIVKFAFSNKSDYAKFKNDYTLAKSDLLDMLNESLPLTKEVETTIRLADSIRIQHKQEMIFPGHLFLEALANKNSLLYKCFNNDEHALEKLTRYYEKAGEFSKTKISDEHLFNRSDIRGNVATTGFLSKLKKIIGLNNKAAGMR